MATRRIGGSANPGRARRDRRVVLLALVLAHAVIPYPAEMTTAAAGYAYGLGLGLG